jgi:hypothetical protein
MASCSGEVCGGGGGFQSFGGATIGGGTAWIGWVSW